MNPIVQAAEDLYAGERYDLRELHGFTRKVREGEPGSVTQGVTLKVFA